MLTRAVRAVLELARVPDPPVRVWRDWVLVAVFVATAVLEAVLRDDVVWRGVSLALALVMASTLLWRRTHPLGAMVVAFTPVLVVDVVAVVVGVDGWIGLNAGAFVLVLPYAVARWGSGRDLLAGSGLILAAALLGTLQDETSTLGDLVGGLIVVSFAELLGFAVRLGTTARERTRTEVRLQERERLARELHDTVAHHITAIVVRAQAGRVVARTAPGAAVDALAVIEDEASRTLAELRTLVGALRGPEEAARAPQPGLAELARLTRTTAAGPVVEVHVDGALDGLPVTVGTAVYRIAQESVTNALRHARHATRVVVRVVGEDGVVRLSVIDDGDPAPAERPAGGYGLVGMAERAALLGGSLTSGPEPGRGWAVRAELPQAGPAR